MKNQFFIWIALLGLGLGIPAPAFSAAQPDPDKMLALGTAAPDFSLTDVVSGKKVSKDDFKDKKSLLVVFMCRHCPYVQHVEKALAALGKDYQSKDIAIVGISSNDPAANADDSPESLKQMAEEEGFVFPVLFDETQSVAKAYGAYATPEFFLFDKDRKLGYHGQFDDSRPNSGNESTGKDVRDVVDNVLAGEPVSAEQKRAVGCGIKWRK